jgi:hypothetical protein
VRVSRYDIRANIAGPTTLEFAPPGRDLVLANVFVQDSLSITPSLKLITGLKLEDDPYSGVAALPSVRLSWSASEAVLLWAAASRAIRSPTPFDRDVVEKLGALTYLTGGADFRPETLAAYEAGARVQPSPRLSFSLSAYYNRYDDLRSIEFTPVSGLPLLWGNGLRGETYGLEAWGDLRVTGWWRLSAGFDARDAMPEGGKLTIETGNAYLDRAYVRDEPEVSPGQYVMLAITDTGSGIAPEILDQVFEPFFTTKPAGLGTGLGLSQVHGFIRQSGGHLRIYSEVGVGTTIKLYLPRSLAEAARPARGAVRGDGPARDHRAGGGGRDRGARFRGRGACRPRLRRPGGRQPDAGA